MPLSNMPKPSTKGPKRKASKPRKRPLPNDTDVNGNLVGSKTSIASRKRRCPRVTLASLQIDDEDDDLSRVTTSFGIDSHSHNTWGIPSSTTIVAPKRKQKTYTFKQQSGVSRNNAARGAGLFNRFPGLRNLETTPEPVEMNCPSRSPFLCYPLEIREHIYGYFLRSRNSILMNYDWEAVERCPGFVVKKVLFICKQISAEALSFLYKNNTFHALLRENKSGLPAWSISRIPTVYLNLVRNVIFECPKDNWNLDWYHKAAKSINTLAIAKPVLETFTIVLTPKQVGFSSTALGFEDNPITFPDFLWEGGEIMSAIMKLACRKLRVVMKKDGGRRIILEVDVFGSIFATSDDQEDWFKEDRAQQLARVALKAKVRSELVVIKHKVEEILHNEEKAIGMGWCRVMDSDERLVNNHRR
ncbi:37e466a6-1bc2-4a68-a5e8-4116fa1be5f6 [Sclerotinia trifoliorum]|uniref:37e466a6-1bc2-4a68-a5e8-4116fa1be5f6 n=1 Tax=Sclerotinia trifoliorum TaxID=28548 RepID=A0A8H2ZKB2_9HELO|nr:37e466a6-1bc2-4a68-a5e8-4116fa1be5f6 [Sclerotinia trifoliorum]